MIELSTLLIEFDLPCSVDFLDSLVLRKQKAANRIDSIGHLYFGQLISEFSSTDVRDLKIGLKEIGEFYERKILYVV